MAAAVTVTVTPLLSGMAHFLIGLSSWLMVSVLYVQLPRFSYSEYDDSHSGSNNIYATINLYIQASNALGILTGIGMASQYVTGLSLSLSGLGRWVSCKRIITLSVPLLGVVASIVLATNDVFTTQKKNGSSTILYALAFAAGVVGSASMSTIFAHALDAGKARPHVMRADVRAVLTSAGAGACIRGRWSASGDRAAVRPPPRKARRSIGRRKQAGMRGWRVGRWRARQSAARVTCTVGGR